MKKIILTICLIFGVNNCFGYVVAKWEITAASCVISSTSPTDAHIQFNDVEFNDIANSSDKQVIEKKAFSLSLTDCPASPAYLTIGLDSALWDNPGSALKNENTINPAQGIGVDVSLVSNGQKYKIFPGMAINPTVKSSTKEVVLNFEATLKRITHFAEVTSGDYNSHADITINYP